MKLTLPPYDIGATDIRVDGRKVGYALGEFHGWRAYLWADLAGTEEYPDPSEQVYVRGRLKDLRARLRARLEETGPWWDTTKEDDHG